MGSFSHKSVGTDPFRVQQLQVIDTVLPFIKVRRGGITIKLMVISHALSVDIGHYTIYPGVGGLLHVIRTKCTCGTSIFHDSTRSLRSCVSYSETLTSFT